MDKLTVISCNVKGLGESNKRRQMFKHLHALKADVFFLQETHWSSRKQAMIRNKWGGKIVFDNGTTQARGTAILFNKNINVQLLTTERSGVGRFLMLNTLIENQKTLLCNIYAPNEDDPSFFLDIVERLEKYEAEISILGGDFNTNLTKMDKRGGRSWEESNTAKTINSFLDDQNWVDVWRILNPETFHFTWRKTKPCVLSRLDYFILPYYCLSKVSSCEILPGFLTDHSFVKLEISSSEILKGRGHWKLNTSYLTDQEYLKEVNKIIDYSHIRYCELNPAMRLEMIKKDIVEFSVYFGISKTSKHKQMIQSLQSRLKTQEKKLSCINLGSTQAVRLIQQVNSKIDKIKEEIQKESTRTIRGMILRSKARYYELGEKNTKYFMKLEKTNGRNKVMHSLINDEGIEINKSKDILLEQSKFYQKLYSSNKKVSFRFERPVDLKLTDQMKKDLEGELTVQELGEALKSTENNKSPGPDGIPADLYKVFFGKLKHILVNAYNYAFEINKIHTSGREGIISLIPKRNRDNRFLKSWRPIILLCADYKLISKVIANRLKVNLNSIIGEEQAGFVKDRNIAQNTRQVMDVAYLCKKHNIDGLLLQVDFEKAFDKVEYSSLINALKLFNFGSKIQRWIEILFFEFRLVTVNNGYSSTPIFPTRGLFQGNPISPYCFILIIELLAIMIRKNSKIEGLKIGEINYLLSLFADDLDIFIKNDTKVWYELKKTIEEFEKISGLTVNYDKTSIYRLGSARRTNAMAYATKKLHWSKGPINILGVWYTENEEDLLEKNYSELLSKAEGITNIWKMRGLSLMGAVCVFNSLVSSLFIYRLAALPLLTREYISKYNSVARDFIWRGKKPKVAFTVIQGLKEQGGLNLSDLEARDRSMKLQGVCRLITNETMKATAYLILENPMRDFIWEIQIRKKDIQELYGNRKDFWVDVLRTWTDFTYRKPKSGDQVLQQLLWWNSSIRIGRKVHFNRKWFRAGINHIRDLVIENSQFKTKQALERQFGIPINYLDHRAVIEAIP